MDQNQLIFQEGFSFSGYERDCFYLNRGTGEFLEISGVSGIDSITDGRAAVFADFDNDGDLDVFVTTIQGEAHLLFRNNIGQVNNYLRISLEGGPGIGRDAYGAIVRVRTSAGTITKIKAAGSGFISQHDSRLLFGLGRDDRAEWVEVTWPNGRVERFAVDTEAGSSVLLREGTGRPQILAIGRARLPDPLTQAERFARGLKIAVGKPMPVLPLKTLDGAEASLWKQLRPGRRILINVWATWCAPCAHEIRELERLRPRFAMRGIDLIGLNVDSEPGINVRRFLAEIGAQYPTYVGGVPLVEELYTTEELLVPFSVILDDKGIVAELIRGWSQESKRRFLELAGIEATNTTELNHGQ